MNRWHFDQQVDLKSGAGDVIWPNALMMEGDNEAHAWQVQVRDGGKAVDVSQYGITAYFQRADGNTVVVVGSADGDKATVLLPQSAYAVPGQLLGVMRASMGGSNLTLAACRWTVRNAPDGDYIDPGHVVPSLPELLDRIAEMESATAAANAAAGSVSDAKAAALNAAAEALAAAEDAEAARQAADQAAKAATDATKTAGDAWQALTGDVTQAKNAAEEAAEAASTAAAKATEAAGSVDASKAAAQAAAAEARAAADSVDDAKGEALAAAETATAAAQAADEAREGIQGEISALKDDLADLAIRTVVSKNIFDGMQEMLTGKVITGADTTSDNSNYDSTKNFIDVGFGNGGKKLYPYSNYSIRAVAEYDESYSFISITNYIDADGVSLNERTRYVRVSIPKETESVYMLSIGELLTEYQQYKEVMLVKQENIDIDAALGGVSENIGVGMSVIPDDIKTVTGIFNADGTIDGNYTSYLSTYDLIPVKPSQTYTIGGYDEGRGAIILAGFRAYLFFGKEKEFLSGWSQGSSLPSTITVPDNCYYIKVSYSKTLFSKVYLSEGNSKPESAPVYNPVKRIKPVFETSTEYIENKWFGKTIVGLGDSITQADGCEMGWIHRVANALGMRCYNHGINGSTIAVKESDPTNRNPMVTRYESLPDADILLVLAGSNDWYYAWTPVGTMDDRTNYTLYGALHNLITGLMQKYENGNIVFATPIKRGNSATIVNANGKTLEEYCTIIKEVCAYYGVPCIDSNKFVQLCPFIDWQNEKYFLDVSDGQGGSVHDHTHPNDLGHEKIANYFVGQIRSLFY